MPKLLVSCDDYIFRNGGQYYCKNQEWYDFYQRYLRVFDELRIANRVIEEKELKEGRVLIDDPRIEIHPLPIFHGPKQYAAKFIETGRSMKDAVRSCDAAVLRLPSTVAQRLSKQVKKLGIPYATEVVFDARDGADAANSIVNRVLWRIIDCQMRSICVSADGVSCVTDQYLQRRYYSKKNVYFESSYSTLNLDKSFFLSPREFPTHYPLSIAHVDLQIGLHTRKGADIIIQALSRLKRERGLIVNVNFAGDDWNNSTEQILSYADDLGVSGQVNCVGYLNRGQLSDFLDKSDLFVLPTKAEGLPRVIIEAIAKGLPTITTPVSGNPELIPEEYLVGFSDVSTLVNRIEKLVTDKSAYEQASKVNYEHSLKYEGSLLQEKRDSFYQKLRDLCV